MVRRPESVRDMYGEGGSPATQGMPCTHPCSAFPPRMPACSRAGPVAINNTDPYTALVQGWCCRPYPPVSLPTQLSEDCVEAPTAIPPRPCRLCARLMLLSKLCSPQN